MNVIAPHLNGAQNSQLTSAGSSVERSLFRVSADSKIYCSRGEVKAMALRKGDRVRNRIHKFSRVTSVSSRTITSHDMHADQTLRPVYIRQGAVSWGLPARTLVIAQEQEIYITTTIGNGRFLCARDLVSRPNIRFSIEPIFKMVEFTCEQAVEISVEGLWLSSVLQPL